MRIVPQLFFLVLWSSFKNMTIFTPIDIGCPGSVVVEWQTMDASLWVRIPLKLNLKEIFESEIHIKESLKMMKLKMYV